METYALNPLDVKFDPHIAKFNKPKEDTEYTALKISINRYGQKEPILMRNGLCGDGIHRVKIASELGIQVLATDVDNDMTDKDFIALCNRNTFTARNDSSTQKAIKAYKLTKEFSYSDREALAITGINTSSKVIGYARYIDSTAYGKANNVLDNLLSGRQVCIEGVYTKSLEVAKRLIAKLEEAELNELINSSIVTPTIDYNTMISTEGARERFWEMYGLEGVELNLAIIGVLNALYDDKHLDKKKC